MTGYILRRLAQSIVVLLLVSMIVFGMLHELPGGTARAVLDDAPEMVAALRDGGPPC